MKKRNLLLCVVFFAFSFITVKAQNKIGIRAGYQASSLYKDGSQMQDTDPLGSFYLGIFRDNKIVPAVHFGVGLEYMQTGVKQDNDNKLVLSYLSLPVYIKAKLGPVFALGGIGANIKISEKVFVAGNSSSPADDAKSNTADFPVFLGAGLKILMFTLEGRYHWGLSEINKGYKSQYFQLGAAVSF